MSGNNAEETKKPDVVSEDAKKKIENNLTVSTKLSTDQLICKSPKESPNGSVKSMGKNNEYKSVKGGYEVKRSCERLKERCSATLCLGTLQVLFGLLMVGFGMMVIFQEASLSQLGAGIWGGCLAVATGTAGVLAGAKDLCPLKSTAQRVAHTTFLALSLISFAVSQLVLVLTASGLVRDLTKAQEESEDPHYPTTTTTTPTPEESFMGRLPSNYLAVVANVGLVLASAVECILAAVSSYKSARALCPCFRRTEEDGFYDYPIDHHRDALVSSWLGKHSPTQPFYVITAPPSTLGRGSKLSATVPITPFYALPPPPPPTILSYPLIPAPLGPVPSPIIRPHPKEMMRKKRKYPKPRPLQQEKPRKSRSRSKSKEKAITTEDVAKTYTGLDRTIAEEFIEICESRNTSLCSDSTCNSNSSGGSQSSACRCQHPCSGCAKKCAEDAEGDKRSDSVKK